MKIQEVDEDICDSLVYGTKILLNTATVSAVRTVPESPLSCVPSPMVEESPSPDDARTFVEHDINGSDEDILVPEFIIGDKCILATEEEIIETLFSDKRSNNLHYLWLPQQPHHRHPSLELLKILQISWQLREFRSTGVSLASDPYNTLQVSLSSPVVILGPNGSGKLTFIKSLIGAKKADNQMMKDGS
ncbi:hypothetical protein BYT27DRAFT_7252296 [Phlegmacium glaucopus]|nr:hypothetical protein BYT27DRAFT_7252296 [Phlegmacium glaucopus]